MKLDRLRLVLFLVCGFALSVSGMAKTQDKAKQSPNLVVILADDLGWNDISLHGSLTPTPNIDKLAEQGVELKNLLVNPVCSPTRSAFYTGRDAVRSGYGGEVGARMNSTFKTIAQTFQTAGYKTGVFGKWHNGNPDGKSPDSPNPMMAGFDRFTGFYGGGTDFYNQTVGNSPRNWYENEKQITDGEGYLTDLIADSASAFISENKDRPFFCMIAHASPHEPFQATQTLLDRVPDTIRGNLRLTEEFVRERSRMKNSKTDFKTWEFGGFTEAERKVVYSAMVIGLDDAVGQLIQTLEETGQRDNTIILFFSDNGAMRFIRDGNLPLRAWKHDMYEGAVRVPAFLLWPNGLQGTTYEPLIRAVDLYPTLASMANLKIQDADTLNGTNHFPAIAGKKPAPEVEWNGIFVYYGAYRNNQWKLIVRAGRCELYDIRNDESESNDLAADHPDIANELLIRHRAWLKETGANVNYTAPQLSETPQADPQGETLLVEAEKGSWLIDLPTPGKIPSEPGDCLVYDMKIESMQPGQAVYISPSRGDATIFQGAGGIGVHLDGTILSSTNQPPAAPGVWTRYVAGIGNLAAMHYGPLRLVVENALPDGVRVQIDNIQILKENGTVTPVWNEGSAPRNTQEGLRLTITNVD